jgi:UDP-2,3-diacylglucosamine hydrolase
VNATSRALFISDCHLGGGPREAARARQQRLLSFLEQEAGRAQSLYLLGDLFDFWFEYRQAIPRRHFHVLAALRRLSESGVSLIYVGGNHDYWAGSFMADEIGCQVHHKPAETVLQGRRLLLAHGDGMTPREKGYRVLRSVLRNPLTIAGYRLLHPDLGFGIADLVSKFSRATNDESQFDAEKLCTELAEPHFTRGIETVVIGHYHHPTHLRRGNHEFIILGDWLRNNTFAVLENSSFALWRWTENGSTPFVKHHGSGSASGQAVVKQKP